MKRFCKFCDNLAERYYGTEHRNIKFRDMCTPCRRKKYYPDGQLSLYRKFKGIKCEFCGFLPIDRCQLDADHIDGNHKNDSPENLQTLCANCHRLKTKLQRKSSKGTQNDPIP